MPLDIRTFLYNLKINNQEFSDHSINATTSKLETLPSEETLQDTGIQLPYQDFILYMGVHFNSSIAHHVCSKCFPAGWVSMIKNNHNIELCLENIYKPVYVHRWLVMLVKFNYPSA
jgi:hypothetical protein